MSWREHASPRRTRPPQVRGALERPRLRGLLGAATVTLLEAPAGYGKTTTLATHLPHLGSVCWYALDADDADPHTLAGGLALAVARLPGGEAVQDLMDAHAAPHLVSRRVADLLVQHEALLVLDEAQHLTAPPNAGIAHELLGGGRLALLSRTALELPELSALLARGDARRLGTADLAFDLHEMEALLRGTGLTLTREGVRRAHAVTEGWPIAARFLTQALAQGRLPQTALRDLEEQPTHLAQLFEYLAREVLGPLDPTLRNFLTRSSVFEALTPDLLCAVLNEPHAGTYLEALARGGTFLTREGGTYRAHPLLRAHLRGLLESGAARELARQGAAHFEAAGQPRPALHASLAAGDAAGAARLLAEHGERWLAQGRTGMVERSLDRLGPDSARSRPELHALRGDVFRAESRYDAALAAYSLAPELPGLIGQARVYLDTVQPALAEPLLERAEALALEHAERGAVSDLLRELRAENDLNAGRLAQAVRRHPDSANSARFALRTGRLSAALALVRGAPAGEVGAGRAARNHREASLLESLLHALLGDPDAAARSAAQGLTEGERLESPFVRSLASARLGHAKLAGGAWPEAREHYEEALALAEGTAAPRLSVEPLMGLAFLAAVRHELSGAHALARQALSVAETSGDPYMCALARLTFALGLSVVRAPEAASELRRASTDFGACGDPFGVAAARLALYEVTGAEPDGAARAARDFPFLLGSPGLLAPARTRAGRAALLARLARDAPGEIAGLAEAARRLGYDEVPTRHPGVEVRVRLLGRLALERGGVEVRDWGRAKARDLLALLTVREGGLSREEAQERLYPDTEPGIGERNFRIVLHALGGLLEPEGTSGYFVERGDWLRLRRSPDLHVDLWTAWDVLNALPGSAGRAEALLALPAEVASVAVEDVEAAAWRYAARLPEALTEEAESVLAGGATDLAARLAERALAVDAAHEPATRVLMRALYARGHLGRVVRTYEACRTALSALDLKPLAETELLFRALRT